MYAYYGPSGNLIVVSEESYVPVGRNYIQVQDDFSFESGYQYHIDWQTKTLVGELISVIPEPIDQVKLLKEQLNAETQRADFLEDCVAEMAAKVYAT